MSKMDVPTELFAVLAAVVVELQQAQAKFPPFNTAHEGYAMLFEEVDELWQHVKVKQGLRLTHEMRREAIQVAAMALRFALEVCTDERVNR